MFVEKRKSRFEHEKSRLKYSSTNQKNRTKKPNVADVAAEHAVTSSLSQGTSVWINPSLLYDKVVIVHVQV